jgi:hypothetical protein
MSKTAINSTQGKIVPLTREAKPLFYGQAIKCGDPDITERTVITNGKIIGFDDEKGDVLVVLAGEPDAARRFKPYQLQPDTP